MSDRPVITGKTTYFPFVKQVKYKGKRSKDPFSYRYYKADKKVAGKSMEDHLRFAVAYWHTFGGTGGDPFGAATKNFPWLQSGNATRRARDKMDAAFEFVSKLGLKYYCFHDFDLVDEGKDLKESRKRLDSIAGYALKKQQRSGIGVLWGTANLFSHPRYMNGAATNPDFQVVAYAAAQVRNAIDTTIKVGGENYVFWGGREGYMSLLNTDMKRETENMARFLTLARDYAREQGFTGKFFIEPKPAEPSKHQYDYDAATVIGFLRQYGLDKDFSLNLEVNHATLAQHTFAHELQVAADSNMLGSIDANRGDYQNGWDTDQFPVDLYELTEAMLIVLEAGGFGGGGINFDAKLRRNSSDLEDLFHAHIGGIDNFARALLIADEILRKSDYRKLRRQRYASFDKKEGKRFRKGKMDLLDLVQYAEEHGEPEQLSGRQEVFENLINRYI